MKKLQIVLSIALAAATVMGCKEKDDDEDTTTDTATDTPDEDTAGDTATDTPADTTGDTAADTAADPVDDDVAGDTITDTPEEDGTAECPADDATHNYISVSGIVTAMGTGSVDGLYVAAISPLDALMNPTPTPLLETTTGTGGTFALNCINVHAVTLGLVILVDDSAEDGVAGTWFPTGTGVQGWTVDTEAVDMTTAGAFAVSNTLVAGLETLITTLDATANGFAMGIVVNGTTHAPINAAVVDSTTVAFVPYYPTVDFTALETDGDTSANGTWVAPGTFALSNITTTATGLTFAVHQAATKAGFCYFLAIPGA